MKKNITKTDKRRVAVWTDEDTVVIQQRDRIAWVNSTGNLRWTDDRVAISLDEFRRIAAYLEQKRRAG